MHESGQPVPLRRTPEIVAPRPQLFRRRWGCAEAGHRAPSSANVGRAGGADRRPPTRTAVPVVAGMAHAFWRGETQSMRNLCEALSTDVVRRRSLGADPVALGSRNERCSAVGCEAAGIRADQVAARAGSGAVAPGRWSASPSHVLSIDVQDWFQVGNYAHTIPREQ
jgi:hypothetical protein